MWMLMISLIFGITFSGGMLTEYATTPRTTATVEIAANMETDPVDSWFDAADDPSIWVHPTNPNLSKLICTDKKDGLLVYNLDGREIYSYHVGKINNVDVRYDFPLAGKKIDLAGGTNRSDGTILLYSVALDGKLTNINGISIRPAMDVVYGFSFYHSLRSGKYYALVVGKQGEFEQYELVDNGFGKVNGKKVRAFRFPEIAEGVVADDEYGLMYIAEESGSIWKYNAEPTDVNRVRVGTVGDGNLVADTEGLTIYYASDGKGYLLVSCQGNSSYAVYDREWNNKYIGRFEIGDGNVDGTSDTDGIDVISFNLGARYPNGLFIAQDGFNTDGWWIENQNFKMVSWEKIAAGLGLIVDNKVNPRQLIVRERR